MLPSQRKLKEVVDSDSANAAKTHANILVWLKEAVRVRNPDTRVDERMIIARLGPVEGETILGRIEASARIPARVKTWLSPDKGGIDIYHPSTLAALAGEVLAHTATSGSEGLSQSQVDALLAAFEVESPRWQSERVVDFGDDPSWLHHINVAMNGGA